jgi:hypothetical protein
MRKTKNKLGSFSGGLLAPNGSREYFEEPGHYFTTNRDNLRSALERKVQQKLGHLVKSRLRQLLCHGLCFGLDEPGLDMVQPNVS